MKQKKITCVFSAMITVIMLLSLLPTSAFAAETNFANSQLSLVTDKQSTLAQGVTQNIYTVYDKNGKQVKMFAATIDMSVDTVKLFTSYQNMDNTVYGMSKLTEQVAAFDKKAAAGDPYYHGTVVAGINASYYNMTTGKPSGVFVMNGNDVTGGEKSAYFAVLKDGTVKIGNAGEYESDKGNIQEALGIYKMLVFDGKIVLSETDQNNAQKYPRQTIGITEDNKVILLSADGNQEPESAGLTLMEQAQVMLDLGCKWAGHLDGGGSMTYGSKPEGEDAFKIVNKPSDGSERSISSGLIVVSTAVASKTFDHVSYDVETEYATPGTPVAVSVSGVSTTGHAAEIPADIAYTVANGTYENGVLTATAAGDVVLTATYNGKEVGSVTIHAVVPEKLAFNSNEMTVPFGKTVTLSLTATYGLNEVKIKASDIQFTLDNDDIGTIDGFEFTAGNGSVTASSITATFVGTTDVVATSNIELGKGSEVIFDFEDGDTGMFDLSYSAYNYVLPEGKVYPVTAETGKVHSGNCAMALDINYGNSLESGYMMTSLAYSGKEQKFENATKLGMWIYISDEDVSTWIRYTVFPLVLNDDGEYVTASSTITNTLADGVASTTGFVNQYQEPGWHYLSIDLSAYKGLALLGDYYIAQFYISDRDGADYGYWYNQHKSYNGRYVMYVDDITVDYSDAVDDREAPVFGDVTYATGSMSDATVLKGQTVYENVLSFGVKVADNTKKNNFTGLNLATAKAYIDGVETACTYKDGVMSLSDVTLADGMHHVKFSICDNQGNYASVIRTINVQANSGKSTIKVVAHDPTLDKILLGSVWYADLVATDIEKVQSVTVDIDLNNMSKWELDHMEVAAGFTAEYSIQDDENIATITLTRTGINEQTGEGVLASLPIRTWELKMGYTYASGTKKGQPAYTYAQFKSMKEFWPIDISMEIDRGIVTFVDGTTDTFSGEGPQVDTEMYKMAKDMISTTEGKAYYNSWNGGHIHTAVAVADKAATCTEAGYTGRTFCEVCNSIVDWGMTVPATGHSYKVADGVLKCAACGNLFTGTWTDGKEYKDGVCLADGWIGDSYYKDGQKLTGIQQVDGKYYDFGDDGVCTNKSGYTGLLQQEDGKWYYSKVGTLAGGWQQIGEKWHYFRAYTKSAAVGEYAVNDITYQFDEQGMTEGAWHTTEAGTRYYYGPSYYIARDPGYMTLHEIGGKTYNFDNSGYLTYGLQVLRDSTSFKKYVFEFGEDGALVREIIGHGTIDIPGDGVYYINEDGYVPMNAGLVKCGEDYYYVVPSGKVKLNSSIYIKGSSLIPDGTYTFGDDGKMISVINGIEQIGSDFYYKENGVIRKDLGLVKVNDHYYYVLPSGKLVRNAERVVIASKNQTTLANDTYYFGDDCAMTTVINGIEKIGDDYYYRVNGELLKNLGLTQIDGSYYYILYSGKFARNGDRYVAGNDSIPAGTYHFGDDGKMTTVFDGIDFDGTNYYYRVGGVIQTDLGLIEVDGYYYYVCYSGKLKVNDSRYITAEKANNLVKEGVYDFGPDGKMTSVINGIEKIGDDYYYRVNGEIQKDKGLTKIGDYYYYICYSGKFKVSDYRYITEDKANGYVEEGVYNFDEYGRLIEQVTGLSEVECQLLIFEAEAAEYQDFLDEDQRLAEAMRRAESDYE